MDWRDRIITDQSILVGKPIIKGTRIAVELVVSQLAQGWTEADVLKAYPQLTRNDLLACLAYAASRIASERVYPMAG